MLLGTGAWYQCLQTFIFDASITWNLTLKPDSCNSRDFTWIRGLRKYSIVIRHTNTSLLILRIKQGGMGSEIWIVFFAKQQSSLISKQNGFKIIVLILVWYAFLKKHCDYFFKSCWKIYYWKSFIKPLGGLPWTQDVMVYSLHLYSLLQDSW